MLRGRAEYPHESVLPLRNGDGEVGEEAGAGAGGWTPCLLPASCEQASALKRARGSLAVLLTALNGERCSMVHVNGNRQLIFSQVTATSASVATCRGSRIGEAVVRGSSPLVGSLTRAYAFRLMNQESPAHGLPHGFGLPGSAASPWPKHERPPDSRPFGQSRHPESWTGATGRAGQLPAVPFARLRRRHGRACSSSPARHDESAPLASRAAVQRCPVFGFAGAAGVVPGQHVLRAVRPSCATGVAHRWWRAGWAEI
jgi:hypothetical protein